MKMFPKLIPIAAVAVLALAGCATTSEPVSAPSPDPVVKSPSPEPSETATPDPEPTATPTTEPTEASSVDAASCEQIAGTPPEGYGTDLDETLGGSPVVLLQDIGARPGAQGEVALDADGVPASYVVASGDTQNAIAERFCAEPNYVQLMNSIRRADVYVEPTDGCWPTCGDEVGWKMELYAGDTLNLNPYTIASVGDQNGQVYANEPDIMMPPQR